MNQLHWGKKTKVAHLFVTTKLIHPEAILFSRAKGSRVVFVVVFSLCCLPQQKSFHKLREGLEEMLLDGVVNKSAIVVVFSFN